MNSFPYAAVLLAVLLVGCPTPTDDDDSASSDCTETSLTWAADIEPILQDYCSGCHLAAGPGPSWLTGYDRVTQVAANTAACGPGVTKAECIAIRIDNGSMPEGWGCSVGDPGCVTQAEFDLISEWVDGCFPQ